MKTKAIILSSALAVLAVIGADAQGKGNGHGNSHGKGQDVFRGQPGNRGGNNRDIIYRRDDNNRYRTRRGDNVYYPGTGRRDARVYRNERIYRGGASNLPPGQAKKIYGQQSAKAFAPGQQKKNISPIYYPYPQRRTVFGRRYDNRYYNDRYQRAAGAEVARRIGGLFGL